MNRTLVVVSLSLGFLCLPPAVARERKASLELLAGAFFASGESEADVGVRGGVELGRRWALEAGLSLLDLGPVELWRLDFSARYDVVDRERSQLYVLAGPGVARTELDRRVVGRGGEDLTLHFGTGYRVGLGERFYLRPELRLRWIESFDDRFQTEAWLAVGARF